MIGIAARAFCVWFGILVLAVGNGLLREAVLVPALGGRPGLVASGLLLSGLILGVAWICLPWLRAGGNRQLLVVGLGWLGLTLVFEFAFGLLRGLPTEAILAAYTFRDGNLWPLVLAVTAAAPWLAAKLRGGA
ncbi:MAG: hypothetical protein R3225_08975 [Halofilum sp. (in: g-proteobacteria)]|nr:hypothetical protein [Halofilum sp. (in: g-proteobacteria)]